MNPLELIVPSDFEGQRLDRFIVGVLADFSRAQIQKLIADGHVVIEAAVGQGSHGKWAGASHDDAVAQPVPAAERRRLGARSNRLVHEGERVLVTIPDVSPTSVTGEALPLDIVFQDADLAVLNKPAGMVVHPAAGHQSGTLVNALLHHLTDLSGIGGEVRPGIVHRLDRGTSGLMVVAKNDRAHQDLARQFHDREVEKEYIALVWGVVQAGRRIDAAIGRDPANRQKMSARAKHAREAVTRITRAHPMRGVTLCQVAIHTGRTHQIRVHLSAIGHPIVGDAMYGGVHRRVAGDIRAVQRLDRPFLHSARLVFHHPDDGRRMEFTAPLPDDLAGVLDDIPGWKTGEE